MARGKWRGGQRTRIRGVKCLGRGLYRIRVTIQDATTHKRKERERIVEVEDLRAAKRVRDEMERELRGVAPRASSEGPRATARRTSSATPRVEDLARGWLEKVLARKRRDGSPRITPNTKARYTQAVERIIAPSIGKFGLDELTRGLVETWRDWLGERYAANTVNGWLAVLRTILRDGGSNLADQVPGLKVDDTQVTDDAPNLIEDKETAAKLMAAVEAQAPQHFALVGLLLTTGLRVSTALALRREDFDPKEGLVTARRRISGGEVLEGVKRSRTARDVVPLVGWVWQAIEGEWSRHNDAETRSGLAFPTRGGGLRARSVLKKPLDAVAKALGLGRLTPHGLRRTAALLYRRQSGSAVSKAIAGHLTEAMHLHYAPVLGAERRAAGQEVFGDLDVGTRVQREVGTDVGSPWGPDAKEAPTPGSPSAEGLELLGS